MATETNLSGLIINHLTKEQFDAAIKDENQLYFVKDDEQNTFVKYVDGALKTLSGNKVPLDYAKIILGSYVGTGTYGPSGANSLTFDVAPKFIWLYGSTFHPREEKNWSDLFSPSIENASEGDFSVLNTELLSTSYTNKLGFAKGGYNAYNLSYAKKSEDGLTIYWYVDKADSYQFNHSSYRYYYLAIC